MMAWLGAGGFLFLAARIGEARRGIGNDTKNALASEAPGDRPDAIRAVRKPVAPMNLGRKRGPDDDRCVRAYGTSAFFAASCPP